MRMRCRRCDFRVAVTRRVVNYGLCRGGPEARVAMCRYRLQQQHLGKHYALHLRTRYSCDVALPIVTSSARIFCHYLFLLFFFIFIYFFLQLLTRLRPNRRERNAQVPSAYLETSVRPALITPLLCSQSEN